MQDHSLHHRLVILVILLVACLIGAGYSYWNFSTDENSFDTGPVVSYPPATPRPDLKWLTITPQQKTADTKAAILARVATVGQQPLYPSERRAILDAYASLSKVLNDTEKHLIITALNTH